MKRQLHVPVIAAVAVAAVVMIAAQGLSYNLWAAGNPPVVIEGLAPGTYVLKVGADGTYSIELAVVVTTDGTTTPPPTGGTVMEVSKREYDKIDEVVSEPHRVALAEKFQALAFGLTTNRRLSGKPFIAIEDAAAAEAAIVADQVGADDLPKFKAWQNAYRVAINATKPTNAEQLATQYENVALGLSANAIDLQKLLKIIMFILELIRTFKGL